VVGPILELARVFPPGRGREFSGYDPGTLVRAALDAADALASAGSEPKRAGGESDAERLGDHIARMTDEEATAFMGKLEQIGGPAEDIPPGFVDVRVSGDCSGTLCLGPGFTTVRACSDCGVLITGGPTRCLACAKELPAPATEEPAPKQGEAALWDRVNALAERVADRIEAKLNAPAGVPIERVELLERLDSNLRALLTLLEYDGYRVRGEGSVLVGEKLSEYAGRTAKSDAGGGG
jgi:hypothetical protein